MAITKIETVTVGSGGAASIGFTSIPGTYTDLLLVLSLRTSDTGATWTSGDFTINGVTTNRSQRYLYGQGATAYSANSASQIENWINSGNSTANTFANSSIYIPNYSGSNNKSFSGDVVTENNSTTALQLLQAGLWASSAAITSLSFAPASGSLVQYSSATLYGITKGSSGGVTVS